MHCWGNSLINQTAGLNWSQTVSGFRWSQANLPSFARLKSQQTAPRRGDKTAVIFSAIFFLPNIHYPAIQKERKVS